MRVLSIFLFLFLAFSHFNLYSQSSLYFTSPDLHYKEGIALINEEKYGAAKEAFSKYVEYKEEGENVANAEYFIAYCGIQLENNDAEHLVETFINKYPNHPKSETAYFELGNLKYDRKQYSDAIKFYEKVYLPRLPSDLEAEARFKLGYCYFTQQEFDKAYEQFNELKKKDNRFKYASNYYSGYINFEKEEYDRAYHDFIRAAENDYYAQVVPELISKTLYKQKKYDELISYATKSLNEGKVKNSDEFFLYLAEAYYKKNDFENSGKYFNQYLSITRKRISPDVMFRVADAKQRSGDLEGAIEGFKQAALENNELGQIASYYLGNLYIKTKRKELAPAAFKTAMDLEYDKDIQKKSHYLFAKVNYELGNYSASINAFNSYMERYPTERNSMELNELLTDAYFRTNNYDAAIRHFEQLEVKSDKVKRAYQQITFNEGARQFNSGNYYQAIDLFEKSDDYAIDKSVQIKVAYWKGETYYLMGQYDDARNSYSSIFREDPNGRTEEYLKSRYSTGYIYYNEKEYGRALPHFKYYVDNGFGTINYTDALTRLADCYYTTKDYNAALNFYDKLIQIRTQNMDYAYYQKGLINGINNNIARANNNFDEVINNYPRSVYIDDAVFQKAQFNFEGGNYDVAISGFNHLLNAYSSSPFRPYALQSRALAKSNKGDHQGSANDYKQILQQFPNHSISENALLGLQQELSSLGQSDQFGDYLSAYKASNPDKTNLENIEFESAKSLYFSQKYQQAIPSLKSFLDAYPQSSFSGDATYYLADSYYRIQDLGSALSEFQKLSDNTNYLRYSRVIDRIAEINLAQNNYQEAIGYLRKSEALAKNKKEQYQAWSYLMESYYELKKYDSVNYYANLILDQGLVVADAENRALFFLGKSAYERKNYDAASDYFLTATNTAKDEYGAESQYLLARIYYEKGNYQSSLETLFDLSKNFSMYEYWLGKSFLLISDNYIAMNEQFQAKATLESIIENASDAEIVDEAKTKLNKLEQTIEVADQAPDTLEIVNPE